MCLVADGLLGGAAIELKLPTLGNRAMPYQKGDTLQTTIVAGLVESMQNGVMAQLDSLLQAANQLMLTLNGELEDGSLHHSLKHIEQLTADLTVSGKDIRQLTHTQLPEMMTKVDTTLADLQMIVSAVRKAEVEQTIETLNATITSLNEALASEEGTVGMLLNDKELYENLNTALKDLDQVVLNVDSVVSSIKARPFIQKKLKK
jgi:phospholipid/cholesterol/gamma-HCH transport system substrate-binding protein